MFQFFVNFTWRCNSSYKKLCACFK